MKKLLFTIQMFVLIAMFPAYLVAELNLETTKLPVENSTSVVIEKKVGVEIQPSLIDIDGKFPVVINNGGITN